MRKLSLLLGLLLSVSCKQENINLKKGDEICLDYPHLPNTFFEVQNVEMFPYIIVKEQGRCTDNKSPFNILVNLNNIVDIKQTCICKYSNKCKNMCRYDEITRPGYEEATKKCLNDCESTR